MKLNAELAHKIVKEARSSLNEHFIIVDTNFKIIASSEPERVGHFHEGAKKAIEHDRTIDITPEDVTLLEGVKPGINMPIKHEGEIIGVIGITGNPQDVRPYADLIRRLTELFIREAIQTEQLESQSRAIEAFIYEWIHTETIDKPFIERSEILGLNISRPKWVVMGTFVHPFEDAFPILKGYLQRSKILINHWLIRWSDQRFLLIFDQKETIKKNLEQIYLSLGRDGVPTLVGVAKMPREYLLHPSYLEAQKALNVASMEHPIVFYESLKLDILLQDITPETQEAFIQNTWQPILENDDLMETLDAYLKSNLSVSKAALALHVHVNTLHYRLKRMEELTGIDIHTIDGIVTAYLALRLLENSN